LKKFSCFLLAFSCFTVLRAQKASLTNGVLSSTQAQTLLTDSIKREFNITYPIFRVYNYTDKSGNYYCVLTESRDSISNEKDTFNRSLRAIDLKYDNGKFQKIWEITDHIKNDSLENSIWFWTKYTDFKDYDKDGLIDPVIIYGTFGPNDLDDGRIKFIIYYKGKKIAIRHQNSIFDDERNTEVDKSFYSLPQNLKDNIKEKMALMEKQDRAIFTAPW